MNRKVDEENWKAFNKGNTRYRKACRFSSNEFWKNIGCLISALTFGLGGLRLLEYMNERENIIEGGYLVEVVSNDGKQVLWGVQDNRVI